MVGVLGLTKVPTLTAHTTSHSLFSEIAQMISCILISCTGVAIGEVQLSNVAMGDKIQTKRGLGEVVHIDWGHTLVYVTVAF